METLILDDRELVCAKTVSNILNCGRSHVVYLQSKGHLKPVPTIYPKWFYLKEEVERLKTFRESKHSQQ